MTTNTVTESDNDAEESYYSNSEKTINYYYTEEVFLIEKENITYKIIYDSIDVSNVTKTMNNITFENFNSNIKDSNYYKDAYAQYVASIGEVFFIKVSTKGEIKEVYGIEKIFEKIKSKVSFKPTDSDLSKSKREFGDDALKSVLQQQFLIFPDKNIGKDLKWERNYDTEILYFQATNNLNYKITDAFKYNDEVLVKIEASLTTNLSKKDAKIEGLNYKVEDFSSEGKGMIIFNASRSCTYHKETATQIEIIMDVSDSEGYMKTKESVSTHMKVSLLN
jgi:hypothetical protein